jgi:hypothetical protein
MQISINTTQFESTIALSAYHSYKAGDFDLATQSLLQVLDVEPRNWLARLMLAVCYHKTEKDFAAERALRFVYQNCPDEALKQRACLALQTLAANIQAAKRKPVEFGRFNSVHHNPPPVPLEQVIDIR